MALVSVAELEAYTGSSDTAKLSDIGSGVEAWLQAWIPQFLGPPGPFLEIINGPDANNRETMVPTVHRTRQDTVQVSEYIVQEDLVAVEERTTAASDWADLSDDIADFEVRD